ncbi:sodium channel and clathrin linker 1-like isoform X2 [Corticium candelabrum]|uniref:sodium channel and clathrin linker 1-like isoform X2 n=1 Tax=Corticium candelabrum TaxID=121492 RepID=UPI002E2652A5|nr:sodium channel and clathrin linker 1-like isoform X2 [Corticium candelabrum]
MDSDAQIQSETSQVEFLKDQVQRLNSMLFRYQKKYLPLEDTGPQENGLSERGPQAPWLFSSKHLTPLLREYDHTIQEQKHQIETYKTELASLQANARQLTDENSRLHSELRRVLELQQRSSAVQRRHGMSPKGYTTDTIQEVVDAVQQEKDQYVEMWQRASQQLQQLQSAHEDLIKELSSASLELQETKEDLVNQQEAWREASSAKQQLEMECQRCIMTAQAQTEEINTLRDELRLSKIEHRAATVKLSESKRTAEELQDKMRLKEREMKEFAEVEHTLRSNINQLENEVSTLESRLLLAQKEASTQHTEKSELELSCIDLQKKVNEFKQQEQDVVTHVRDAMQLVENSLLERDQAIVREKQRAQEVTRLQDAMTHLMDQTGEKTQQEVAAVRAVQQEYQQTRRRTTSNGN